MNRFIGDAEGIRPMTLISSEDRTTPENKRRAERVRRIMAGEDPSVWVEERVREILASVKPLAGEYYQLTGKPLGVTGELAEYLAAEKLGLKLAVARTAGYDALRGTEKIQIKGRAYGDNAKPGQRLSRIKLDADCDVVMFVLLDNVTLDLREIWEAPFAEVKKLLELSESKARARGALGVAEFKRIANQVWPSPKPAFMHTGKVCPECGHLFKGNSYGGIDAHWRANHAKIMTYEVAWPLIKSGSYQRRTFLG